MRLYIGWMTLFAFIVATGGAVFVKIKKPDALKTYNALLVLAGGLFATFFVLGVASKELSRSVETAVLAEEMVFSAPLLEIPNADRRLFGESAPTYLHTHKQAGGELEYEVLTKDGNGGYRRIFVPVRSAAIYDSEESFRIESYRYEVCDVATIDASKGFFMLPWKEPHQITTETKDEDKRGQGEYHKVYLPAGSIAEIMADGLRAAG